MVSAASAWPVYHYGEAGYDRVKSIVDEAGDILGIVTVDDAMEWLLPKDWRQRLPRVFS